MSDETVLPYTVLENGYVTNENGYVAIRYYMTIPQHVQVNGREYMFGVSANICMAWVHPDDVQKILSTVKVCCGGQQNSGVYRPTDETHVRRWLGISER